MFKKRPFYKKNKLLFILFIFVNTTLFSQVFIDYSDFDGGNFGPSYMWNPGDGGTETDIDFSESFSSYRKFEVMLVLPVSLFT